LRAVGLEKARSGHGAPWDMPSVYPKP
jgi:hypothetical protein